MTSSRILRPARAAFATLACLVVFQTAARADIFTLTCTFWGFPDGTQPAPVVGNGWLSYEAPTALLNGSFDLKSLTIISLHLSLGGFNFTLADLTTPSAEVNIEVRSSQFFFSNDKAGGFGTGTRGGTADFQIGASYLTTEPYHPTTGAGLGGRFTDAPGFYANIDGTIVNGRYGAVPEPSTVVSLLLGGLILCGVLARSKGLAFTRRLISR